MLSCVSKADSGPTLRPCVGSKKLSNVLTVGFGCGENGVHSERCGEFFRAFAGPQLARRTLGVAIRPCDPVALTSERAQDELRLVMGCN